MSEDSPRYYGDSYLLDYSGEHLLYECWMLVWSASMLADQDRRSGQSPEDSHGLQNALVESFAIHLRNLIAFFYVDSPQPDDVVAQDFMPKDVEWGAVRLPMSDGLRAAKTRAHKQIAHLTTRRFAGSHPEKEWQFIALSGEIVALIQRFAEIASREKLSPQFRQFVGSM